MTGAVYLRRLRLRARTGIRATAKRQHHPGPFDMKIEHHRLRDLTRAIFTAAGCQPAEAERIAVHLVEANLVGHDSHGVIRVPSYVLWLKDGRVLANQTLDVSFENDVIAVADGQFGF